MRNHGNGNWGHLAHTWNALVEFIAHSLLGLVIVVVIALTSHGLGLFIHWLEPTADPVLIVVLRALEYGILGADVVVGVVIIGRALIQFLRQAFAGCAGWLIRVYRGLTTSRPPGRED